MSPENARVFLVEDSETETMEAHWFLEEQGGHTIVLEASSLEEALDMAPLLPEEGINVAVIDANLSPGERDGADGKKVVAAIREQAQSVKIVVYSGGEYDYGDEYVPKPMPRQPRVKIEEVVREI